MLLLDKETAAVDLETDQLIQRTSGELCSSQLLLLDEATAAEDLKPDQLVPTEDYQVSAAAPNCCC